MQVRRRRRTEGVMRVKQQTEPEPRQRLLTVRQSCERLGISHPTLYELLNSGQIKSLKIGRARRVPSTEIDAFVDRQLKDADA
jgi:excisionase family DNA binding protein